MGRLQSANEGDEPELLEATRVMETTLREYTNNSDRHEPHRDGSVAKRESDSISKL